MNERIKQLERQCWSHHVDGTLVDGQLHFDPKKFAELIVKECAEICNQHPSKTFKKEWDADVVAWDITQRIKGRFGVEE
jgi:RNA polymerase subunit RPABC4/transcription elongation factor Spt4